MVSKIFGDTGGAGGGTTTGGSIILRNLKGEEKEYN
jgi:hypothetical protein